MTRLDVETAPLPDERGILLEHVVACEPHRRLGALWPEAAFFRYRTRGGAEVDFVLEVGREAWGAEIKARRRVDRRMLRGLSSLVRRSTRCARRIVDLEGQVLPMFAGRVLSLDLAASQPYTRSRSEISS